MKKYIYPLVFLASLALASESDDLMLKAQHGGIVKKTSNAILEVVQEKEHTSIYITGHDHKNFTDQKLSLSAIARIGNKEYPLQISWENDHYSARPANTYMHPERNMVLLLTLQFPQKKDLATFNIGKNLSP